jgi:hypothetical protein
LAARSEARRDALPGGMIKNEHYKPPWLGMLADKVSFIAKICRYSSNILSLNSVERR